MKQVTAKQAQAIAGLIDDFSESDLFRFTFDVRARYGTLDSFVEFRVLLNNTTRICYVIGPYGGIYSPRDTRFNARV